MTRAVEMVSPLSEAELISRFIAEHGVTRGKPAFAAPSRQAALSEREVRERILGFKAKDQVSVQVVVHYLRKQGVKAWTNNRRYTLQGLPVTRGDLYRAANQYRVAQRLVPYKLPTAGSEGL